ncbi:hypothetical protein [Acidithiobacillus sp.]
MSEDYLTPEILAIMEKAGQPIPVRAIVEASDVLETDATRAKMSILRRQGYVTMMEDPEHRNGPKLWARTEMPYVVDDLPDASSSDASRIDGVAPLDVRRAIQAEVRNQLSNGGAVLASMDAACALQPKIKEEDPLPTLDDILQSVDQQRKAEALNMVNDSPLAVLDGIAGAIRIRDERIHALKQENYALRNRLRTIGEDVNHIIALAHVS